MLVDRLTGYSLYSDHDYKRCVCNSWSTDLANCMTAEPDPEVIDPKGTGAHGLVASGSAAILLMTLALI